MNRYHPNGIMQLRYNGVVFAALGGLLMKKERPCQLCGSDNASGYYPLQLCDGTWLILCQECLHSGPQPTFGGIEKIINKYFKAS